MYSLTPQLGFAKEACGDYKSSGDPESERCNLQKAYFKERLVGAQGRDNSSKFAWGSRLQQENLGSFLSMEPVYKDKMGQR